MVRVAEVVGMEGLGKAREYETLNFYCDWVTYPVVGRSILIFPSLCRPSLLPMDHSATGIVMFALLRPEYCRRE
jgi:hypothetical protein